MSLRKNFEEDPSAAPVKHVPFLKVVVSVLVLAVVVALGVFFYPKISDWSTNRTTTWQAVFLTNGQVYFGHVYNRMGQYVTLKNIYYLEVNQTQQLQDSVSGESSANPELSLIKLGNELHGPQDRMQINRDHILFIEDLQETSQVVDIIKRSGGQ